MLVITLMQTYNEKEQVGQGEIQNIHFENKRRSRKKIKVPMPVLKEIKYRQKPGPEWNKRSGGLRTRPHPAKLPTLEKN